MGVGPEVDAGGVGSVRQVFAEGDVGHPRGGEAGRPGGVPADARQGAGLRQAPPAGEAPPEGEEPEGPQNVELLLHCE